VATVAGQSRSRPDLDGFLHGSDAHWTCAFVSVTLRLIWLILATAGSDVIPAISARRVDSSTIKANGKRRQAATPGRASHKPNKLAKSRIAKGIRNSPRSRLETMR
jgi:hypothetical protein